MHALYRRVECGVFDLKRVPFLVSIELFSFTNG